MRVPVYKAPPPVASAWTWTGCYIGGHAGGLWANSGQWVVRTPGGDFFGQSLGEHVGGHPAEPEHYHRAGEYAFTNFLSGFLEYSYYDFGTRDIGLTPEIIGLRPAFVDLKATTSVVRAGLNLRLGHSMIAAAGP